jgi:hypothetical protein
MDEQFSKEKILFQLERIVNSNTFSKTAINVKLLSFLVHASLDNAEIKEFTIGVEMFGDKYDPIKNDNKARVYVYHLRKKLEKYYAEEATNDEIIFSIGKGQYQVQFQYQRKKHYKPLKSTSWTVAAVVFIFVVSLFFLGYIKNSTHHFWRDNLNQNYPNTVLIGDHYTLSAPIETKGGGVIRDFSINSEKDFNAFIQHHPEKASVIIPNSYTYITKMGAFCTKQISRYFTLEDLDFNLLLGSDWDMVNINKENIIYVGQAKNMRSLKHFLLKNFPQLSFRNNNIVRTDKQTGEEIQYRETGTSTMVDYALVAKFTSPAGNSFKFFISEHDFGVINSLNYFTNNDSIVAFYEQHQIGKHDFLALFKVTGWERTGYNMEFEWIDLR